MPAIGRKDILSCTAIRPIKTDKAITTIDIAITTIDIAITITIEIGLTTRIEIGRTKRMGFMRSCLSCRPSLNSKTS